MLLINNRWSQFCILFSWNSSASSIYWSAMLPKRLEEITSCHVFISQLLRPRAFFVEGYMCTQWTSCTVDLMYSGPRVQWTSCVQGTMCTVDLVYSGPHVQGTMCTVDLMYSRSHVYGVPCVRGTMCVRTS